MTTPTEGSRAHSPRFSTLSWLAVGGLAVIVSVYHLSISYAVARRGGPLLFEFTGVSDRSVAASVALGTVAGIASLVLFLRARRRDEVSTAAFSEALRTASVAAALGAGLGAVAGIATVAVVVDVIRRALFEPWHGAALLLLAMVLAVSRQVFVVSRRALVDAAELTDVAIKRWAGTVAAQAGQAERRAKYALGQARDSLAALQRTGAETKHIAEAEARVRDAEQAVAVEEEGGAAARLRLQLDELALLRKDREALVRNKASPDAVAAVDEKVADKRQEVRSTLRAAAPPGLALGEREPATMVMSSLLIREGVSAVVGPAVAGGLGVVAIGLVGMMALARTNDCALGSKEALAFGGTRSEITAPTELYRLCVTPDGDVDDGVFQAWRLKTGLKIADGRMIGGKFTGRVVDPVRQSFRIDLTNDKVSSKFEASQVCGPANVRCVDATFADFIDVPALKAPDPIVGHVRSLDCPGGTFKYAIAHEPFGVEVECKGSPVTFMLKLLPRPRDSQWFAFFESFEFQDSHGQSVSAAEALVVDGSYGKAWFDARFKRAPRTKDDTYRRGALIYEDAIIKK